jgi:thiamine-monophosphate kinase
VVIGSGDDAAVTVPGGATATSVDALVEGVHFRMPPFEPVQVGHKALAVALSDLAAMGATAGEAYVQLGVPEGLGEPALLELAGGLGDLAAAHSVVVAGGDLVRAPVLVLALTVVGHADTADRMVARRGARVGDLVVVTGDLGGAAAGLLLLERPELAEGLELEASQALRLRQLTPQPRLAAGAALAQAGATAMIDLSDGLGGDAGHLAERSGAAIRIEASSLPLAKGVAEVAAATRREPLQLAVSGGEDYELLAALPPERLGEASSAIGDAAEASLTSIGEIAEGEGVEIRLPGGALLEPRGHDQLSR